MFSCSTKGLTSLE